MTQFIEDPLFYYNNQIRKYILQFMAVFSEFKVMIGKKGDREPGLIPVHLTYGAKDRVVAHIFSEATQNKPLRLPAMSTYMNNINLSPQRFKGSGVERRDTYLPTGGSFPDDITTVRQLMPVPYDASMELSIYTSNRDEHHQILEQILMFFNPVLQIQTNDDTFDWTKITTIELVGIRFEENYPAGTDRRIIQTTLDFNMPIYIAAPAKLKKDFVKDVFLRIGTVSTSSKNSFDIISELDNNGFTYQQIFDSDNIDFPEE